VEKERKIMMKKRNLKANILNRDIIPLTEEKVEEVEEEAEEAPIEEKMKKVKKKEENLKKAMDSTKVEKEVYLINSTSPQN
jgi:hypothetical protein